MSDAPFVLVEILEVSGDMNVFIERARVALGRLERDGVRALRSVNFFGRPASNQIGAVLEFETADALVEHTKMIGGWPEFKAFADQVKLVEARVHGRLPPEAEAFLRQFGDSIVQFETHVAGFHR